MKNPPTSTQIGTIFLDTDLCISHFTPSTGEQFNILPEDIGRPLMDCSNKFAIAGSADLHDIVLKVLKTGVSDEREVYMNNGRYYQQNTSPLINAKNKIDGIVLNFMDVTRRIQTEHRNKALTNKLRVAINAGNIGIWEYDYASDTVTWDENSYKLFGQDPQKFIPSNEQFINLVHPEDRETFRSRWYTAVAKKQNYDAQFRVIWPDSSIHYIENGCTFVWDESGRPLQAIGYTIDFTDFYNREQALALANRRLEQLNYQNELTQQSAHFGYFWRGKDETNLHLSKISREILGLDSGQNTVSVNFLDERVHPADHSTVLASREQLNHTDQSVPVVFRHLMPNGEYRWIKLWRRKVVTGAKENVIHGVMQDFTEVKQREHTLQQINFQLEVAQEIGQFGHFWRYLDSYEIHTSKTFRDIMGLDPDQETFNLLDLRTRFHPDDQREIAEVNARLSYTDDLTSSVYRYLMPDNSYKWLRVWRQKLQTAAGESIIYTTGHDITDTVKREQALEQLNHQLEIVQQTGRFGHYLRPVHSDVYQFSKTLCNILELDEDQEFYPREEFRASIHPDDLVPIDELGAQFPYTDKPLSTRVRRMMPDGSYRWLRMWGQQVEIETGEQFIYGVIQDVSDNVKREQELEQLNHQLELAQQTGRFGHFWNNIKDDLFHTSKGFRDILALNPKQAVFHRNELNSRVHPEDKQRIKQQIKQLTHQNQVISVQLRYAMPTGEYKWIKSWRQLIETESGELVLHGVNQDITETKERERELEETNRKLLEVQKIGRLGSWEAHLESGEMTWSTITFELFELNPETVTPTRELLDSLVHPDDLATIRQKVADAIDHNQSYTLEHRMILPSGRVIWVSVLGECLTNEAGEPIIRGTFKDITDYIEKEIELQQLNESLEERVQERTAELVQTKDQLEAIFINSGDGLILLDNTLNILDMNPMAESLFGRLKSTVLNTPFTDYSTKTNALQIQETCAKVLETGDSLQIDICLNQGGAEIDCEVIFSPISSADGTRIVGALRNITERKLAEEKLLATLERERELSESRNRFVSTVSHEFRTPLTSILSGAETLDRYRKRMSDEDIQKRLGNIREQVIYMKGMMDDVIQLQRLQGGRLRFEPAPLDLKQWSQTLIQEFKEQPQMANRLSFTCLANQVQVPFDHRLMRHILSNLIGNALKYSASPAVVYIDLVENDQTIEFIVRDQGIGIPPEDIEFLFEPFIRASNVGNIQGTGLGLSIVKRAIEAHGGTIQAESEIGVGTTFTVVLPKTAV